MGELCRMSFLKSLLSYAWPITEWEGQGKYGPLKVVWEQGHLVVNSNDANQSYGNLHAIWQQCLDDQKVSARAPRRILLLGFGAGSSAHVLRRELGVKAPIIGVDGDAEMLRLARTYFNVEILAGLELVESDALEFAHGHRQQHDLVLVDLCHELDLAPGVDEDPFIASLKRCLAPGGLLCFNTIVHDGESRRRSQRVSDLLRHHFGHCQEHLYQGINRVLTTSLTSRSESSGQGTGRV